MIDAFVNSTMTLIVSIAANMVPATVQGMPCRSDAQCFNAQLHSAVILMESQGMPVTSDLYEDFSMNIYMKMPSGIGILVPGVDVE